MSERLRKVLDTVTRIGNPRRVILFGSHARGTATEESDIDLLVLTDGCRHHRALAQAMYRELRGIGVGVDLLVAEEARYPELQRQPGMIYATIAREGVVVYDRALAG